MIDSLAELATKRPKFRNQEGQSGEGVIEEDDRSSSPFFLEFELKFLHIQPPPKHRRTQEPQTSAPTQTSKWRHKNPEQLRKSKFSSNQSSNTPQWACKIHPTMRDRRVSSLRSRKEESFSSSSSRLNSSRDTHDLQNAVLLDPPSPLVGSFVNSFFLAVSDSDPSRQTSRLRPPPAQSTSMSSLATTGLFSSLTQKIIPPSALPSSALSQSLSLSSPSVASS